MLSESWIRLDRIGLLAADSGHRDLGCGRVRSLRTLCVTYANHDPSRPTATKPPARTPLARTWLGRPALRACPEPIPRCTPRRPHSGCRQPESLTRSLAGCRALPSVRLARKTLIHQGLSRCDRLHCLPRSCGLGLVLDVAPRIALRSTISSKQADARRVLRQPRLD